MVECVLGNIAYINLDVRFGSDSCEEIGQLTDGAMILVVGSKGG